VGVGWDVDVMCGGSKEKTPTHTQGHTGVPAMSDATLLVTQRPPVFPGPYPHRHIIRATICTLSNALIAAKAAEGGDDAGGHVWEKRGEESCKSKDLLEKRLHASPKGGKKTFSKVEEGLPTWERLFGSWGGGF